MSNVKEIERAELHKTIWRIANDLRGSVDGRDFESYVPGMPFYRSTSDNLTAYLNVQERGAGDARFDDNITVSTRVGQPDASEAVDITALDAEIARIVSRQAELRTAIDAIAADLEGNSLERDGT